MSETSLPLTCTTKNIPHQILNRIVRRAPSCRQPSCRARCSTSSLRESTNHEVDNFERVSKAVPFILYAKIFLRLLSFLSDEKLACRASIVDLGTLQETPSTCSCELFLVLIRKQKSLQRRCSSWCILVANKSLNPIRVLILQDHIMSVSILDLHTRLRICDLS